MRGDGEGALLVGRLENFDIDRGLIGCRGLVIIHAAIDGANQHRSGAEAGIVEAVVSCGIGLRAGDGLHRALELDQDYVDAGGWLAGCAVRNCARYRASVREGSEQAKRCGGEQKFLRGSDYLRAQHGVHRDRTESTETSRRSLPMRHAENLHCEIHGRAPFEAAWRVAGVGAPPVRTSMSASTRAASISSDCLISS